MLFTSYTVTKACLFSRELGTVVISESARYTVEVIPGTTVFRYKLLNPLAYAISSVLLSEFHLIWTCATISAVRLPLRFLFIQADTRNWSSLAAPASIYGIFRVLVYYQLLDFVEWSSHIFFKGTKSAQK